MRQTLQNKFNLLAFLFVIFFLLMLPMFTQVKADTRESMQQAKHTVGWKWVNDIKANLKPENLENTEIEDYWAEEAKKQNPDCGDACNPDADRDGDGVSNADEVKNGRNPSCNEDVQGVERCQNADQFNLTKPDDPTKDLPVVILANITIEYSKHCQTVFGNCQAFPFPVNDTYRRIEMFLNVTGYQGVTWTFQLNGPSQERWNAGSTTVGDANPTTGTPRTYARPMGSAFIDGPAAGNYTTSLQVNNGAGGPAPGTSGKWDLIVYGIR